MTETFSEGGRPLLTVVRLTWAAAAGEEGAAFLTAPEELLQVGVLTRPAGHVVPPHAHNPVERVTVGTAEVLLVLSGMIAVTAFGAAEFRTFRLGPGDVAVVHPGCVHKVRWTAAGRVLEVKSGPFLGTEADKDRGEGSDGTVPAA